MSDGASAGTSERTRRVLRRVVVSLLLLLAAGMVWYSASIKGEPESATLTDAAVEQLIPANDTPTALRQAEIGIVLVPGWDADLVINGIDIPEDEERQNGPPNQVSFSPGKGKVIESLPPGVVQVTAVIWRPVDGQTHEVGSRAVRWTFRVA
jgi:hypothetical protein